jgi:hypothetical protein
LIKLTVISASVLIHKTTLLTKPTILRLLLRLLKLLRLIARSV